jgi:flagellar biosynthesis protein FlhF
VVALVGPTGVGKTTTIAKIAANCRLRGNKRVGLVTIDTYRIAAVDQLRTYAEIIGLPLRAVLSTAELKQAIAAMSDLDVILIDTAGRSQNDQMRLSQLRSFIDAADADEVHLVLSAAANPRVAQAALERFGPLGANRITVTKLDEAASFGMILNVSSASEAPVAYVTTGQDVPEDIAPADPVALARLIAQGEADGS